MVDRQIASRSGTCDWMENDIAADFQQLSYYCKRALRNETDWYRSLDHMIETRKVRLFLLSRRYI